MNLTTLLPALVLLTVMGISQAAAAEVSFSAVNAKERQVVVALKKRVSGAEPHSWLWLLDLAQSPIAPSKIELDPSIADRDVIAIIPLADGYGILSQYAVEQGDDPQLHLLDLKKRSWKKMGTVACPSIHALEIKHSKLVFRCEKTNEQGKTELFERSIRVRSPDQAISLPQVRVSNPSLDAQLEGETFAWDVLTLRNKKKAEEKIPAIKAHE